ncbi:MAG: DsbE family thiol:disulfide interchange protein [Pseudomonadota bacterium]|nr:DsbE family thiol:disulfide interchange protein [Pseudomonadota bacterium]
MIRYLLPASVFMSLVVFLAIGLHRDPTLVPSPLIGKPAPDFRLPRLQEPTRMLTKSDLKGKVSLINVWATWCGACYQEHPVLLALARSRQVSIYGLNWKDQRVPAMKWLEDYGNPYTAVAFDKSGKVGIDWGVYGAPETFVVDRYGIIRYKYIGPLTADILKQTILPLIDRLREG